MKNRVDTYGLYAGALGVAVAGSLALGLPLSTLVFLVAVVACPLIMLIMMYGPRDRGRETRRRPRGTRAARGAARPARTPAPRRPAGHRMTGQRI